MTPSKILRLNKINKEGFQIYPNTTKLLKTLREAKYKCGANTPQLIKDLLVNLKRMVSDKLFQEYNNRIEKSFTNRLIQKTLEVEEKKPFLALALTD